MVVKLDYFSTNGSNQNFKFKFQSFIQTFKWRNTGIEMCNIIDSGLNLI